MQSLHGLVFMKKSKNDRDLEKRRRQNRTVRTCSITHS